MDWLKNLFNRDEEEATVEQPAEQKPIDPTVKQYLTQKQQPIEPKEQSTADKYMAAMNDNEEVDSARSNARWSNLGIGLLGAINKGYGSGDNSDFVAMQNARNDEVKQAEARKEKKANNVLMADKLARTDVERQREDTAFGFKENQMKRDDQLASAESDPMSDESMLAQKIAKMYLPKQDFSKATATQIYKAIPHIKDNVDNQLRKRQLDQGDERIQLGKDSLGLRTEKEGRLVSQKKTDDARNALKDMRATDTWKSSEKMLSNADNLRSMVDDAYANGGQSLAMLGPTMARAVAGDVGALSDADVTRYVKNPALVGGLIDTLKKLKSGQISEDSRDNIKRLVDIAEQSALEKRAAAIDREATLFARRNRMTKDEAKQFLDEQFEIPDEANPAKPAAADPAPAKDQSAPVPAPTQPADKAPDQRAAKIQEYKALYPDYSEQEIEQFLKDQKVID